MEAISNGVVAAFELPGRGVHAKIVTNVLLVEEIFDRAGSIGMNLYASRERKKTHSMIA